MENEKDRRMTIMLVPFMSCSARLPVYGLLTAAFFPQYGGLVVFSLYLLGLIFAIGSGILLKKLVFQGEPAAFVLELPPYRPAHPQKYRPPRVGEGKGLPGEGGHPDSGHECTALVPPVLRL